MKTWLEVGFLVSAVVGVISLIENGWSAKKRFGQHGVKPEGRWSRNVSEWLEVAMGFQVSHSVDDLSRTGVGLVLVGLQVRLLDKSTAGPLVDTFCRSVRCPKGCVNLILAHELQDSHDALQYFEFLLEADAAQSPLSERLDQIVVELERAFEMLKLPLCISSSL